MAPEQVEGHEADSRTDIFAFGAVVYELLTGHKAFDGKTQASLLGAIMHANPPLVSTVQPLASGLLDRVVNKCLAKNPDDRWQSARDIASELGWIAEALTRADAPAVAPSRAGFTVVSNWPALISKN
jgi:serine/threonine-protein kinase